VRNIDFDRTGFISRLAGLFRIVLDPRSMIIDVHAFDFSAMAAALLRPFRKSVTYMDHNTLLYGRKLSGLRALILRKFLARADRVSFVSREGLSFYEREGFTFRHAVVQTAYLAPPREDESGIVESYSAETRAFLDRSSPLLVANASQIVFSGGQDLYGLDLCIELVLRLRASHPDIGLLFALANPNQNSEYLDVMRKKITEAGAERNFHFLTGQQELWPVFRRASLMLRPTTGDGFAVSVGEALDLGCKVLASDAVERPAGVTLFRNRDLEDFVAKAAMLLADSKTR
jgi:glycosyltransferase involved in cell wall biosynthesis